MTFLFPTAFTSWLGLLESILHVDKIHFKTQNHKHNACATRSSPPADRFHDTFARFRTGVKFSPRYNYGVNSRRGDSRRHDILWWYHVNKCRAMWGSRSELTPAQKWPRCHVKSPSYGVTQSRSQSPRYPCPAKRTTLDKGNAGSGKQISPLFQINSTLQNVPGQ